MKNNIKVICFDVDGTLVEGISWFILTEGLGCSTSLHKKIFGQAQDKKITFHQGERLLVKMYQDSGKAGQKDIKKIFASVQPRPEAKKLIQNLKKKGYKIYLVSGSIDLYVTEIAKKLNVDGFFANTTLLFGKDGILKKIHYKSKQAEVKVKQLNELAKNLNIKLKEMVFIGDSDNDLAAFRKTGHGIAVHTSNKNLKEAAWKIAESLKKIEELFQ